MVVDSEQMTGPVANVYMRPACELHTTIQLQSAKSSLLVEAIEYPWQRTQVRRRLNWKLTRPPRLPKPLDT